MSLWDYTGFGLKGVTGAKAASEASPSASFSVRVNSETWHITKGSAVYDFYTVADGSNQKVYAGNLAAHLATNVAQLSRALGNGPRDVIPAYIPNQVLIELIQKASQPQRPAW